MASVKWTLPPVPVNCCGVAAGTWDRFCGKVTGRCPEGSVFPYSTLASAVPLLSPGYQASTTAATWPSQGIATGAPALTTTTVRGLAAATAETSSFWAEGRLRLNRSAASVWVSSETTTTAVEAALAAATAALMPGARPDGVAQVSADESPVILMV